MPSRSRRREARACVTYNSDLNPPSTYPALPSPPPLGNACTATPFTITVTGGVGGAVIPTGVNTNETLYIIRHAEAHPESNWDDGNYVCAGQWRALDLPNALRGKINPQQVYSIDPAQAISGLRERLRRVPLVVCPTRVDGRALRNRQ